MNVGIIVYAAIPLVGAYFVIRFFVRSPKPRVKVLCFLCGILLCVLLGVLDWLISLERIIILIFLGGLLGWSYVFGAMFCENGSSTEKITLFTRFKFITMGLFLHAIFIFLWVFCLLSIPAAYEMGMGGFSNLGSFMLHNRLFHVILVMALISAVVMKVIGFFTGEEISFFGTFFSLSAVPFIIAIAMGLFVAVCLLFLAFVGSTPGAIGSFLQWGAF